MEVFKVWFAFAIEFGPVIVPCRAKAPDLIIELKVFRVRFFDKVNSVGKFDQVMKILKISSNLGSA